MSCNRYQQEIAFSDTAAQKTLAALPENFQVKKVSSFEELCGQIHYLQSVPTFFGELAGRRVLEMGCGNGWISLRLAKSGAQVWACDISPKMIEVAKRYAQAAALDIQFEQMVCEEMTYEDEFFDCVFMHMALHHCDIPATARQIRRVLKPGGKAVLVEDYAYHPLMRGYRFLTPERHTEQEHPLKNEDLSCIASHFSTCNCEYYGLFDVLKIPQTRSMKMAKRFLRFLDERLYENIPPLKKYSQLVLLFLTK